MVLFLQRLFWCLSLVPGVICFHLPCLCPKQIFKFPIGPRSTRLVSLLSSMHRPTARPRQPTRLCVVQSNQPMWSTHGLARVGTQFQMFSAYLCLHSQDSKCCAPSIQHHLHCCCCLWRDTKTAFLRMQEQNKHQADCHQISGPNYSPGQKVWLSDKNILRKRAESIKLPPNWGWETTISNL